MLYGNLLDTAAMFVLRQIFVSLLVFFVCVSGQVYRPGGCPNVSYVQVHLDKAMDRWYKIEHFPEYHPQLYYTRCFSEILNKTETGTYKIFAAAENSKTCYYANDFYVTEVFPDKDEPGVTTHYGILGDSIPKYRYKVLDIDYNSHVILYGCVEAGPDKKWSLEYVSIFSRTPKPLKTCLRKMLHEILEDNGINPDFLVPMDQENCPEIRKNKKNKN